MGYLDPEVAYKSLMVRFLVGVFNFVDRDGVETGSLSLGIRKIKQAHSEHNANFRRRKLK